MRKVEVVEFAHVIYGCIVGYLVSTTRHNHSSGPGRSMRERLGDRQSRNSAVAFAKVNRWDRAWCDPAPGWVSFYVVGVGEVIAEGAVSFQRYERRSCFALPAG